MFHFHSYRMVLVVLGAVLAGATLWGCGKVANSGAGSAPAEGTMLAVGAPAPAFTLQDEKGQTVRLEDFRGKKNVVLVFYPRDESPVCTKQLCAIRDDYSSFEKTDAAVFGINPQDAQSHKSFVEKQHFPFPLLVDRGAKVEAAYGAKGLMTNRTVYGIDKSGKILAAFRAE